MHYRRLGKTEFMVSEISLGTWQVGGRWGDPFDPQNAENILHKAIDLGINFIDTADVYSDGLSESAVAKAVKSRSEEVYIATKCGRRIQPHVASEFSVKRLTGFVEDSLRNMNIDCIDLIQLHCPPTEIYYRPEIFEAFDRLKDQGKIRHLGVSVEKVEEAIKAIEYPNVTAVQIIFNMFRHRPADLFFKLASEKDIGIIARVPLASGLLTGKMTEKTQFSKEDHRFFNRNGDAFDKGETFSGVNYQDGLEAVEQLQKELGKDAPMALYAIRWILMFPEISCVIPGASRISQLVENSSAGYLPPFNPKQMEAVQEIYNKTIKSFVHHLW